MKMEQIKKILDSLRIKYHELTKKDDSPYGYLVTEIFADLEKELTKNERPKV